MKVLIIPEDQVLDQYILKPVVEHIFADLGRVARIDVLPEPRIRGIAQALSGDLVADIVADNPMEDLFLLIVDRDCDRYDNTAKARSREQEHPAKLIACLAVQEVEVWMLALYRDEVGTPWQEVRADCDPKERYADPFLADKGWNEDRVGKGRKRAMRATGPGWKGLLSVCPEIVELKTRIQAWLDEHGHR